MEDKILEAFLTKQYAEGVALSDASDLLQLFPIGPFPHQRYIARFLCKGLVRRRDGVIAQASQFDVGIWFPLDYLRRANPFHILTWLAPREVFHPNISDKGPFICVGALPPGTTLTDILFQLFEIISFNKVTMREDDALNRAACSWARQNQHRFPVDRRPLKRRNLKITDLLDG